MWPKMYKLYLLIYFCFVTFSRAQLVCQENHTYQYDYVNEIKLWGDVKQTFYVSSTVEIDCIGESSHSKPGQPAYDFNFHISNYTVTEGQLRPEDALKLCKNSTQDDGSSCHLDNPGDKSKSGDIIARDTGIFTLPAIFTQRNDGKILRISFMAKDFENRDVINFKKGVVSALQTHIVDEGRDETQDETDSTGTHKTQYNSTKNSDDIVIRKQFNSKDDDRPLQSKAPTELRMEGETRVQTGEIVSSKGKIISEVSKKNEDDENERPGDTVTNIDVGAVLNAESSYKLDLKKKRKRSVHRQRRMARIETGLFVEDSIAIETEENIKETRYKQLEMLYRRLQNFKLVSMLANFVSSKDDSHLKLIKQIIMLESELGYENVKAKLVRTDPPLVDQLIHETYGVVVDCTSSWVMCREFLSIFTLGGGILAEQVFIYLMSVDSPLSTEQGSELINIVSFLVNPSNRFVTSVIGLYKQPNSDAHDAQAMLLALCTLTGQKSISDDIKMIVVRILQDKFEILTQEGCPEESGIINVLEAVGNLADQRLAQQILRIARLCHQSKNIRMAVVHAVRGLLSHPDVEDMLLDTLRRYDCEVTSDMVEILKESMNDPRNAQSHDWPRVGLNKVDSLIIDTLANATHLECMRKVSASYFKAKQSPKTDDIVYQLLHAPSTSNFTSSRKKRDVEHQSCTTWDDYSGRYSDIQSSSTFKIDRADYSTRQHCLGHFRIGGEQARADFYAGVFAGFSSGSVQGKLLGKLVAKGVILGKTIYLATIYAYDEINGLQQSGKVYVKIGRYTLLDRTFSSSLKVSKDISKEVPIPLASIPLAITTLDFTLTLTAKIRIDFNSKTCGSNKVCMSLTPTALPSASADASIGLAIIRGGASIVIEFNYYVRGEAQIDPNSACVSLYHGNRSNRIAIEFWYELPVEIKIKSWFPLRIDFRLTWGDRTIFGPSSLSWRFGSSSESKIFSNC